MKQQNTARRIRFAVTSTMTENIKTLGTVAEYINGRAFKPDEWEKTGKPIIRIQNLTQSSKVCNRTTKDFDKKFLIKNGDLLFSWSATLGAFIWRGEDAWLNQHIFKIIPNDVVEKLYLYYYLKFIIDKLQGKTHGSGMVHITLKPFKETEIPLPPLDEQKRIVAVIERLFSKLDAAKSIVQKILDGYELRRAAIFHKAFTGELTKNFRAEHGLTLEDWQEKKLGDVLFPTENTKPIGKNFRYIDIDSIDNKRQQVRSPKIIETEKAPSRAIRKIKEDDVLFSMVRPYLKNIALIDENLQDCIASSGFFVCRCKGNISSKFLYNFLCSENAISYLMQFMKGDNSPSIRKEEFLSLSVNLPPINEQKEIVRVLESLLEKEQRTKEIAEKILSEIDLLKRAFRGELGTKATVKKM